MTNNFRFLKFRFVYDWLKKYARPFFPGVNDSCEIRLLFLNGRCHGNKFSSFSHIFHLSGRYFFCHVQTPVVRLLYSGRLVDSFLIVELLQICYGFVVQLVTYLL